jgi:hypothetical protein
VVRIRPEIDAAQGASGQLIAVPIINGFYTAAGVIDGKLGDV